jgi:hypothetical protein
MKYAITEKLSAKATGVNFADLLILCTVFGDQRKNQFLKFANGKEGYCVMYNPWGYGLAGITKTVLPTEFYSVTHDADGDTRVVFCTFEEVAFALNFDEEEDFEYKEA